MGIKPYLRYVIQNEIDRSKMTRNIVATTALLICLFNFIGKVEAQSNTDTLGLPDAYTSRRFVTSDNALFDAGSAPGMPGNIVYSPTGTTDFQLKTIKAVIKPGQHQLHQATPNGINLKSTITADNVLNGSSALNGLKAENGQVIDLMIHDDSTFSVPAGATDTLAIRKRMQSINASERQHYYYILSVTTSTMRYRVYKPAPNDTVLKAKGVFIAKGSKTKSKKMIGTESEKTEKDQVISMELVPVDDIINPKKLKK